MKEILKKIVISMLTLEAKAALMRYKPRIVAVTGNVGKTSTKDAIYAVMAKAYGPERVRKSYKSFNSEIGLPLTILGLENAWSSASGWLRNIRQGFSIAFGRTKAKYPEWLVLEIGADHPGDIKSVTRWLSPDVTVLTRMSDIPVHVEFFKDAADVLDEKMALARALKPGGTLVVNADDPHFADPVKSIDADGSKGIKKVFYGSAKGSAVEIEETGARYTPGNLPLPIGEYGAMKIGGEKIRIELSYVIGGHLMYPVAAACAVGVALGLDIGSTAPEAFKDFKAPAGRMRSLKGLNGTAIIDDSYNSSPLACAEALKTMANLSIRGRKIAALADMKELGENARAAHRDIGRLAADCLHTLVTVGDMARNMAEAARDAGMPADRIMSFDTSIQAADALKDFVRAGDVILVKGSQSMRMERVSKALLSDQARAGELLVRQEEEWGKR